MLCHFDTETSHFGKLIVVFDAGARVFNRSLARNKIVFPRGYFRIRRLKLDSVSGFAIIRKILLAGAGNIFNCRNMGRGTVDDDILVHILLLNA